MIQFRRILMINWMYYGMQVMDFGMSNLITGITGSGKSAMIDALQVVMLGEAGGGFFNKSAAGKQSERNIRTYMRGKYGADEFRRVKSDFTSYIVAEFFDTIENEAFCYGFMCDLNVDDTLNQDFFYIGQSFREEWFLKNKAAKRRGEIKSFLAEQSIRCVCFNSNADYRSDILHRLGIYDESFFRLFRNAVAYKPLDKIEDFIVNNICHVKGDIDIDLMRQSINAYQQMSMDLSNFRQRKMELESISGTHADYTNNIRLINEKQYLIERSDLDVLSNTISQKQSELEALHNLHYRKMQESERIDCMQNQLGDEKEALIEQISSNPEKNQKDDLKRQIEDLQNNINSVKEQGKAQRLKLLQRAQAWHKHFNRILDEDFVLSESSEENLYVLKQYLGELALYTDDNFNKFNYIDLTKKNVTLTELHTDIIGIQNNYKIEQSRTESKIIECNHKISELEKGKKQYDYRLLEFRLYLENELSKLHGKEIKADILADLIEIKDARWINIIEGYMNRQKMYLLVEPSCYKDAFRIYKQYYKDKPTEKCGLIDGEKVYTNKRNIHLKGLSLVVSSVNKHAMAYVEYLLGRVVRADSVDEIRNYNTAVTDDGHLYKGYVFNKMPSELWKVHYTTLSV